MLLKRAFEKVGIAASFHISQHGDDAMTYLKGEGEYGDRSKYPFPRILITDLKMPGCDGFQLLKWLDDHPKCRVIPTVVFTGSNQVGDVQKAFELGAHAYFVKPIEFQDLMDIVRLNLEFWTKSILPEIKPDC